MEDLDYDPRYLAGIVFFNRGDFFEAHEAWEGLWMDTSGPDKKFFQGLIQAAVGLCHFCNGNLRGAAKLYKGSRDYMASYGSNHLGLDLAKFWDDMARCFDEVLKAKTLDRKIGVPEEAIPDIHLDPTPAEWPEPEMYLPDEH